MRNNDSRHYTHLLQRSGQCDFETTKFHCSGTRAALGVPWRRQLPSMRRARAAFLSGQAARLGMGRARMKWKLGWSRGHQNAWAPGGTGAQWCILPQIRTGILSGKAGEAFPSRKRCHRAARLSGFARRQNVFFQFPQHISRTQGITVKHEVMNSPRCWHCDWVTTCQSAPSPWRKLPGKSWEIHTTTQHFWATCKTESIAARERRWGLCASIPPRKSISQDRIFCCYSQQEDIITWLRPSIWPWAMGSERKCHWNSEML